MMKRRRQVWKFLTALILASLLLSGLASSLARSEAVEANDTGIVVEDANITEEFALVSSGELSAVASSVGPRVILEYANSAQHQNLAPLPPELMSKVSGVSPRVIVEYANSVGHQDLTSLPAELLSKLSEVAPRVIIEYANSTRHQDLTSLPPGLLSRLSEVTPRVIIEYANTIWHQYLVELSAGDTTPPANVTDLAVSETTANSINLSWHAPGDDGNNSTASQYDIRYSTSQINETNWASANQCADEPPPQVAGSAETFTITGLSPNTTYYLALKTADEVPNWSGLSNVVNGTTSPNQPPEPPIFLSQNKTDGTEIPVGGTTDEGTVVVKGVVSDPDGDQVKLQIELRKLDEYNGTFLQRFTEESDLVDNSTQANVSAYGLVDGNYHWKARSVDACGSASEWVDFGNNTISDTDFSVRVDYRPIASFTYSPQNPVTNGTVTFDASDSYDPDGGSIVSYQWDFGDENTDSGESVQHSYSSPAAYTVVLTVVDGEGTESSYSATLIIFSQELKDDIEELVSRDKVLLAQIFNTTCDVSESADYFYEEVTEDEVEIGISTTFAVIGFLIPSPKIEDLPIPLFDEASYAQFVQECPKMVPYYDAILKGELIKLGENVAKDVVSEMMKFLTNLIFDRWRSNDYSFNKTSVPILQAVIDQRENSVDELENDVLTNLSSLSPEEINLYREDIRYRDSANVFISSRYAQEALLPTTLASIKQADESDWKLKLGELIWKGSTELLCLSAVSLGAPSQVVYGAKVAMELLQKRDALSRDGQMLCSAVDIMNSGHQQINRVSRNTFQGLHNIKQGTPPHVAKGNITSIENVVEGDLKIFGHSTGLFATDVYSRVTVRNTGTAEASYELSSYYGKSFYTYKLLPGIGRKYELPVIGIAEAEINPNEEETIIATYKQDGKGPSPSENWPIYFTVIGESDTGIYAVDVASTKFGTKIITAGGEEIPEEELAELQIFSYPVRTEVRDLSGGSDHLLRIYVENPFDFPISANLSQQLPSGINITSTDGNVTESGSVSWQIEFQPAEKNWFDVIFTFEEYGEATIEIPPAVFRIRDQVNDCWTEFPSNPVSLSVATLEGHVNFSGVAEGPKWVRGLEVRFFSSTTHNEMAWSPMNATTNSSGYFNITVIDPGTYDIGIKNWTSLSELVSNVTLTAGNTTVVDFGTMREGDCNGDDWVTLEDRSLLYAGWDTQEVTQGGHYCDLNRDGWLTLEDRSLMYANWDQSGD